MPSTPPPDLPKTAEQSLQELVYAVSHDLGASARTMKGFSDLLSRRYGEALDAEGQNFLRLLSKGATDLQAQLDGLLAYSRVETQAQPLKTIAVTDVWQSVLEVAMKNIREADAEIEHDDLPVVLADAKQLAQLLSELLQNSLKFRRHEQLLVHFSAQRSERSNSDAKTWWQFRLTDNGRGIAPQQLNRIFQIFQRCCADVPGVGAGLAVAERIVQRHGGVIWAESVLGSGTSICFTLPGISDS